MTHGPVLHRAVSAAAASARAANLLTANSSKHGGHAAQSSGLSAKGGSASTQGALDSRQAHRPGLERVAPLVLLSQHADVDVASLMLLAAQLTLRTNPCIQPEPMRLAHSQACGRTLIAMV